MSDITRRQALAQLAAAFAAGGVIDRIAARDVHAFAQATSLPAHDFRTLQRLTDLIVPVDGGKPGALEAHVAEWIDRLAGVNEALTSRYTAGLAWIDAAMKTRGAADFVSATPAQQTALLDVIAFKKNRSPDNDPGIDFFVLLRRMTVDGFYTSEIGTRDINPSGRPPLARFVVPQEDVDYVLRQSPFTR